MHRSRLRALLAASTTRLGAAASIIAFGVLLHALPALAKEFVNFDEPYRPGTVVIKAPQRELFFVYEPGKAIRYPVAVPRKGKEWSGYTHVASKLVSPAWSPPREVKANNPHLPDYIPGGAPDNPMGARAIMLRRHEIAIHGTTQKMRKSIGSASSCGCIRMRNEDIIDLFDRVKVGAPVVMVH